MEKKEIIKEITHIEQEEKNIPVEGLINNINRVRCVELIELTYYKAPKYECWKKWLTKSGQIIAHFKVDSLDGYQ